MAEACFNPITAVQYFYTLIQSDVLRFEKALGKAMEGKEALKYMSTHPPSRDRIQVLEANMEIAQVKYSKRNCNHHQTPSFMTALNSFMGSKQKK